MKIGEQIWSDFFEALKDEESRAYAVLGEAHHLFSQAVISLDAGISEGTALLCRATLESAFYLYLTRNWSETGVIAIGNPSTLDGEIRRVEYSELSTAIKKRVGFSDDQLKAIDRIQKDGNFVAHFASHRAKELQWYSEELVKVNNQLSERTTTPEERKRAYDKVAEKLKFWITTKQALDNLRDTSSVLLTLFSSVKKP
jgi:hypothetical protein